MLIVVMIVLRLPTFFRRSFYAHQYLFSNEARVLALLTNTEVNANMAMRAYLNAHASVVHFAADGRSPLHHASVRGSAAITSLLLRANCSVDGGGAANLPLHAACEM